MEQKKLIFLLLHSVMIDLLTFSVCTQSQPKVLIITHCYNRPDFIEIQYKTFQKFLKDDFEFVIFYDAPSPEIYYQIETKCKQLGLLGVKLPKKEILYPTPNISPFSEASWRIGHITRYIMEKFAFHYDGIVMAIDSDMFLIKDFSVVQFLEGYDIAGLRINLKNGGAYLWNNLIIFRMNTLPNKEEMYFLPANLNGNWGDTGAQLHYYFKNNPTIRIKFFSQLGRFFLGNDSKPFFLKTPPLYNKYFPKCNECIKRAKKTCDHIGAIFSEFGFSEKIIKYIESREFPRDVEFVLNDTFFHYRRGTNYGHTSEIILQEKTRLFNNFFTDLLHGKD